MLEFANYLNIIINSISSNMKKRVNILGANFDQVGLEGSVEKIQDLIKKGGCHQVGTLNPEYIVKAQTSKQLVKVIAKMNLVVPDGVGIVWAAKIKRLGRLKRVRGGDLVEKLAELCQRKRYKIALFGGGKGVAQKALVVLQKRYPGLQGFADEGPPQGVNLAHLRGVRLLLTALSFKGPIWIDRLLGRLKKKKISLVALEVGGVFNYLAGRTKRPPRIIQKIGFEWLWRLFWEPWRLKRQLSLLKFLFLLLRLDPKKP